MLAAFDILCWSLATAVVLGVRHDFSISEVQWESVLFYWVTSSLLLVVVGYFTKFYRGRFLVGSFDEAAGLAVHVGIVAVLALVSTPMVNETLPRSIPVLVPPVALLLAAAGRWYYRSLRIRSGDPQGVDTARPVLVYGAGDAGRQVLQLLRAERRPGLDLRVVGFLDDNPGKRNLRIQGVPVLGTGEAIAEAAEEVGARAVILAIPQATGDFIGKVQDQVASRGLDFYVLPRVADLLGSGVDASAIRPVEIGDVLGRHQVTTDLTSIAGYLTGKRVLITGAGGSIGSELTRQVHHFGPGSLVMLDRDESALHGVQLAVHGHGLLDGPDTVLVDIRDAESLRSVFEEHRPEVVFHAAALKHLPMLERFPAEGWKTNVLGTLNLLNLSAEFGVERFVNVSTDKAADATSVLGATKRLAERLTAWHAQETGRPYMSVRFGNVLGSRGSMLHTFNAQIAAGGPVTVTHPEVTRYFMTIPEACELVIQAGSMGGAGEVMVLEMGSPVRILDVAKRMIRHSGAQKVEIVFTGLRPGEKLHEVLFSDDEVASATDHPMVRTVPVPPVAPAGLDGLDALDGLSSIRGLLRPVSVPASVTVPVAATEPERGEL